MGAMARIDPVVLDEAVRRGIVGREQADALALLSGELSGPDGPRFTFTNVLYYLGGMLAIGAMTLFMTLGWSAFGGWGVCVIACVYASAALAGARFLLRRDLATPAGILAALAICLVPLAVYGAQEALGSWPPRRAYREYHTIIDWRWAWMEIATLAAGSAVLWRFRTPFAVMPIAVTLWYMSMDFAPLLAGGQDASWRVRKLVSMGFGLGMIAISLVVDAWSRRKPDFAFWLYLFGALAFWGGFTLLDSGSQLNKFLYGCLNAALIFVGAILARRIFTVLGGLGLFGYLGYLSYSVFKDGLLFPFALTGLGLALVASGVWWQRREERISRRFRALLPEALRAVLEER